MRLNRRLIFWRRRGSLQRAGDFGQWAASSLAALTVQALSSGLLLILCLAAKFGSPARCLADEPGGRVGLPGSSVARWDTVNEVGDWIWDAKTYGRQTCRFWRSFEITNAAPVIRALLRITADNEYTVFLDGRQVGRGSEWRILTEYDLTWVLKPGSHVLAVDAFNMAETTGWNDAGVILGLSIHFADGSILKIPSDDNWRVVPATERKWLTLKHAPSRWPKAKVIGPVGVSHWWRTPLRIERVPPEQPVLLHFWQTGWFQIMLLAVCGTAVLVCLRLMAQAALQSQAQQLLQVERARIARDIHDDLGAGLTKLVLMGEVAQSELQADSESRNQIDQLCERARELCHIVDEVVWAINSRRDTLRDFTTYVCKYAQAFLASTSIRCRLDVEAELPPLSFDLPIRRNLFLAVKEALNNAAKYSRASELFLRIHRRGEGLAVTVEDNGQGFDQAHARPDRNGLTNMAQRMEEVGGRCQISGKPGAGCRVEFILPRIHAGRPSKWRGWRLHSRSCRNAGTPSPQTTLPRPPAGN